MVEGPSTSGPASDEILSPEMLVRIEGRERSRKHNIGIAEKIAAEDGVVTSILWHRRARQIDRSVCVCGDSLV